MSPFERAQVSVALIFVVNACAAGGDEKACNEVGDDGTVELEAGLVRGHESGSVCAFLGVPYAAPPVEERRFRPPMAVPHWTGVRDARDFGPWCPQLADDGTVIGDEDCLYLNVWTESSREPLRPVMVFLHGGGNVVGSSSEAVYDGTHLAEQSGAVIATLDYRLGPLGYLAHPALDRTFTRELGNYGLTDQVAALAFVRRHAPAFGGDPERVLVFGQSAGSRNLCALIPRDSGNLFRAAALQSGACEITPSSEALAFGQEFVAATECAGVADIAGCLRALPTETLLTALPDPPTLLMTSRYGPNDMWLDSYPVQTALTGYYPASELSVIVGANAEEVGHVAQPLDTAENYETLLQLTFGATWAVRVMELYPPSEFPTPRDAWIAVVTDARYVCPSQTSAEALSWSARRKTYRYLFAHRLDHGPGSTWGAFHGLELLFLFGTFGEVGYEPTDEERALSERMVGYWSRLAETGDPNGEDAPEWPAFERLSARHLRLDSPIRQGDHLRGPRCDFWLHEYIPL